MQILGPVLAGAPTARLLETSLNGATMVFARCALVTRRCEPAQQRHHHQARGTAAIRT